MADVKDPPAADAGLATWLEWLERLHPVGIDLGLERVGAVATRMGLDQPRIPTITVAGTNGKGSVCALLEAMLGAAGYRVGCYTSPHLLRYNERVRVAAAEASDAGLCAALARTEHARGDISLTFFEFGTLAALDVFARAGVDVRVLEVGLGGRLDATNVVAADVAVVTTVGLDHADWLGRDRDAVGREKAGIARAGSPLVCGTHEPTPGLVAAAAEVGAPLWRRGEVFEITVAADGGSWTWTGTDTVLAALPLPALVGGYQLDNAATALAALAAAGLLPGAGAVATGLARARVPGRFEVRRDGAVETILDVAHNPDAAGVLARALAARPCPGETRVVAGVYADKDAAGIIDALVGVADRWYTATLAGPRGRGAAELTAAVTVAGGRVEAEADDPVTAYREARRAARPGDRVVVAGSFATVAPVSRLFL